jgi:ribose transport system ATP-binding protein
VRLKIGLIPEDRKRHGIISELSVMENIAYSSFNQVSRAGIIVNRLLRASGEKYRVLLRIATPSLGKKVKELSGGNQQKVVLARWLATNCDLLIFDEPTRGIDVGAKQEIYELITQLAAQGKGIILISSEMPELLGMSDRIIVMHEGRIMGELSKQEATQNKVLHLASGEVVT